MTKEKHGKSVEKTKKRKTEELMLSVQNISLLSFFLYYVLKPKLMQNYFLLFYLNYLL
jgi:hypothetical protein